MLCVDQCVCVVFSVLWVLVVVLFFDIIRYKVDVGVRFCNVVSMLIGLVLLRKCRFILFGK